MGVKTIGDCELCCVEGLGDYGTTVDSARAGGEPLGARIGEEVGAKFGEGGEGEGVFDVGEGGIGGRDGFDGG